MNTRDRLAEVIADHTVHVKPTGRGRNYARCSCGWISPALIYIDATYEAHRLHVADALLPVVDAIAAERAAEELEAAAASTKSWPRSVMSDSVGAKLRSRAAGLTDKDGQR
ncbi:MAG TPA: hypothetical protein VFH74_13395 [Gaiellales bacterium]|nr:hypothetical protein [Gaiellales bacterium]